jgi:hypothetical protein
MFYLKTAATNYQQLKFLRHTKVLSRKALVPHEFTATLDLQNGSLVTEIRLMALQK